MSWQIPGTWEASTLADICHRIVDGSHNPPPGQPTGSPMLSAKNIQGGKVSFDDFRLISEEAFDLEDKRTNVSAGDVLLTIVGALGRTAVVSESHPKFTLQRSVAVLKPDSICSAYLRYLLESPVAQSFFLSNAKGTAQKGIYLKALGAMEVPVAPLAEQTRIAAKLDELLAQVDTLKARIDGIPALLKRFRQSVLAAAVSGRLTEEWRNQNRLQIGTVVEIDSLADVVRGGSPRPAGHPDFFGGDIPWITVGELTKDNRKFLTSTGGTVTELGKSKSRYIPEGTLLLTNSGATLGVPKIANIGGCINDGVVALLSVDEPLKSYLYYCLFSMTDQLRGLNQGAAQPNLNTKIVKAIKVILPEPQEQTEIVRRIEQLFAFADQLEAKVSEARTRIDRLTQSILAKAFRGELVPQDPSDEPASVLLQRIQAQRASAPKPKRGRGKAVTP